MSEFVADKPFSLDDYQSQVIATQRKEFPKDWKDYFYDLIHDEYGELSGQHGPSALLFLRGADKIELLQEHPDLIEGAKEEIGDLLWFDFAIAAQLGKDAKTLCAEALKSYTGQSAEIDSFPKLQELVRQNAHRIEVLTKWGIYHPELPADARFTSLLASPYYVFNRSTFRLTRALVDGKFDVAPFTASQMEPVSNLETAVGNHINVLTYLAQLLNLEAEEIARTNITKLRDRESARDQG